jgi:hypothetical protein
LCLIGSPGIGNPEIGNPEVGGMLGLGDQSRDWGC